MKFKLAAQLLVSAVVLSATVVSPAIAQYSGSYPGSVPPGTNPIYPGSVPPGTNPIYPGSVPPGTNPIYPGSVPPGTNPIYPGSVPPGTNPIYPPPMASTSFICGQVGGWPATLVQVNGRMLPSPLIIWQTASADMSPQQRCQMVSQRMTVTVAQNGGKLSNLLLTTGKVHGYSVICFVNTAESCNPNNVIMTLIRGENARNPGNVLAQIIRFSRSGGGRGLVEESGGIENGGGSEEIIPGAISLEQAVNQLAGDTGGGVSVPPTSSGAAPSPGPGTASGAASGGDI